MKSHIVCTLILFQIVSIYGASGGYQEYRSPLNIKGDKSTVVNFSFMPLGYVLDWGDLACGTSEEVHAVVLMSMQSDSSVEADIDSERVKHFVQTIAPSLLRNLKQLSKEKAPAYTQASVHEPEDLSKLKDLGLSNKSLLCRLTCANLAGAVHICCDANAETYVHYQTNPHWQASAHIKDGRPFFMGSADEQSADKGIANLKSDAEECDLHSLIFHRNPALILQDQ
jgi:hypothetical protein